MLKLFSRQFFQIYFIAVLLLLTVPAGNSEILNNITIIRIRGDYFFHILIFLPWAFFGPVMKKRIWLWFATGLLFAAGTEALQYLIPWRQFNINDMLSNSIGIIIGFVVNIPLSKWMTQIQDPDTHGNIKV